MKREIFDTPDAIVREGAISNGIFRKPFHKMNFNDVEWKGGRVRRFFRRLRLKEWLGFGIEHPDWYFSIFFQDAKYLGSSSFYAFDRRKNGLISYERSGLPGGASVASDLYDGRSEHIARGYSMECFSHINAGEHTIRIDIDGTRKQPGIIAEIALAEDLKQVQPLIASIPLRNGYNIFTHKAPMPAKGFFRIGGEEFTLDPSRDIAIMDEHKSFLPYRTVWRWATFAGYEKAGRLIAANLGDHDTIEDQANWNENCFWIGDSISLLGAVEFEFDSARHMKPWKIRDMNGRTELTFYPQGDKVKNVRLGFMGMRYFQPCGTFKGYITDDSGDKIAIDNMYGVAEMMDARF